MLVTLGEPHLRRVFRRLVQVGQTLLRIARRDRGQPGVLRIGCPHAATGNCDQSRVAVATAGVVKSWEADEVSAVPSVGCDDLAQDPSACTRNSSADANRSSGSRAQHLAIASRASRTLEERRARRVGQRGEVGRLVARLNSMQSTSRVRPIVQMSDATVGPTSATSGAW